MENNIEDILKGNCPVCLKESQFEYIGRQNVPGEKGIDLYNCVKCYGTISLKTFLEFNSKRL